MSEMDWAKYAEHYDEMCELNPAYQQNIDLMRNLLRTCGVRDVNKVCDVGAGTGNFLLALLDLFPKAEFTHLDGNSAMSSIAERKIEQRRGANVSFIRASVEEYAFPHETFDLVVCTNTLYATNSPPDTLAKILQSMRSGGIFFVIDFGKVQNTMDWTLYILRQSVLQGRFLRYLRALVVSREVIKQNRATTAGQKSGRYWTHSEEMFSGYISRSGFRVLFSGQCYRGYCNYALGIKEGGANDRYVASSSSSPSAADALCSE